ncbi:MAG: FeoA family protein [Clostridia bacterium]
MKSFFSLSQAALNKDYIIDEIFAFPNEISTRLVDLGFVRGEKIKLLKKSVFGKTYLVQIKNYVITIRKSLAKIIKIKEEA